MKRLAKAAAIAGSAVALVAAMHTRAARPLLAHLGVHLGCPVSLEGHSPDEIEAARARSLVSLGAGDRAAARPALGFTLMRSSRADVMAWAGARGVSCTAELSDTALRCRDVPADARGAIDDLYLRFDPSGALVALDAMRAPMRADEARARIDALAAELTREAGPPSSAPREASSASLDAQLLHRDAYEYRFRDYAADVSATNFGDRGVLVREQYRAIPTDAERPTSSASSPASSPAVAAASRGI